MGLVSDLTELSLGNYSTWAAYTAQNLQAAQVGTVAQIPNELQSVEASISVLTDPVRLEAFKVSIANQMNRQSGGPTFVDLSDAISDVQLTTTAQGASTLQLTIIDPDWRLSTSGFIQEDVTGRLWPPIDINFPEGTDCVWRLCQAEMSVDYTQPNVTLTFEDRPVSWLREINSNMGGVSQAAADSTLAGFLKQLVDGANAYLRGHPAASGSDWQPIRLVQLVSPSDPNYAPPVAAPTSSNPQAPLSRQNPNKDKSGLTAAQKAYIDHNGIPFSGPDSLTLIAPAGLYAGGSEPTDGGVLR